jgi:Fic family protein
MEELNRLLKSYQEIYISPSLEEEQALLYEYVYATNKLEGNQLSLLQTTELFKSDTISGNNIRNSDILEQKGMYRALKRMILSVKNKEELSINLILELNWLCLGSLWNEDYYISAKEKGQSTNEFKISQNVISIKKNNIEVEKIMSLSSPENVQKNMKHLIETINNSSKNVLEKCAYLAQEIWIHQPFVDGNKRTGRLLINFLLMKQGFPLFVFNSKKSNYNSLLVEQYYDGKPNLISDYIKEALTEKMNASIVSYSKIKKDFKGFRLIL